LFADRFAQIEHENRLLLHRMSEIMSRKTIDNASSSLKFGKSLNRESRKRELQRITRENQSILRRIQSAEPVYNHWKWEEEGIAHAKLVESMQEYPSRSSLPRRRTHEAAAHASTTTGILGEHDSMGFPGAGMGSGMYGDDGMGYGSSAGMPGGGYTLAERIPEGGMLPDESYAGMRSGMLPSMGSDYTSEAHARAAVSMSELPAHGHRHGRLDPLA
jgi:hypothetical protein